MDIGAYQGGWTLDFLSIFPECKLLMIDAQSSKKEKLKLIVNKFHNVSFYEALISSKDGIKVNFLENETASFASYNQIKNGMVKETKTIDTILRATGFPPPDFIKLDIQGFELEALRGAKNALMTTEFCLMECTALNIGGEEPMLLEVLNFMDEQNFQLYDISQIMRRPYDNALYQMDILFIDKNSTFIKKKAW